MLPLAGFSVLSLAANIPGPLAAARLQQLGAKVVKVEAPAGDPLAYSCPAWYTALCRDMTVVSLDLKTSSGRDTLYQYLSHSDLLLTATRPAGLHRLGLDWPTLHARYPRLCQVAVLGYPSPNQNMAGHDLTYQASLGLVDPPHLPRTLIADLAGAKQAISAALALLLTRERGGGSGYAEVALSAAAADFAAPLRYGLTAPGGLLGGGLPTYQLYPAQDGWLALAALEPHFAHRLQEKLNLSELTPAGLTASFSSRPAGDWQQWAIENDLPLYAVTAGDDNMPNEQSMNGA